MTDDSMPAEQRGWSRAILLIGAFASILCVLYWVFSTKTVAETLVETGSMALSQRDFPRSIQCAESAIGKSPQLASAWKLLAEAAGQSSQFDQSLAALDEYARLNPDQAGELGIQLGSLWMRQNFVRPSKAAFRLSEKLGTRIRFSLQMQEQFGASGYLNV